ncbi:MAG: ribonuclease III [Candidatus Wallbacteria bacterium HGW-Wallbacteria-1]|jgi:ribonuclease-3|uniref:Ribonuclease 3 n=1 Tax=Candidatus Wallbacteria bacterium HGW-Wallbacteria-1 TaxID=2013854 RepID=A0A2N1PTI0_9BACT|nr:MAG: ribonuclease III [Candidatus Wallbacteria bacterium HGW-Wallbacteria-1]
MPVFFSEGFDGMVRKAGTGTFQEGSEPDWSALENLVGHSFSNPELLISAMTHKSMVREARTPDRELANVSMGDATSELIVESHNERLEMLGDAVIELVVTEFLFNLPENHPEGKMTRARAFAVNRESLVEAAVSLGLERFMRLGAAERRSGGARKARLQADAFEALIGAIYLDAGMAKAGEFILSHLMKRIYRGVESETGFPDDHKSMVQELLHRLGSNPPIYELVNSTGPDHAKIFEVMATAAGFLTKGTGKSRQAAEQQAARKLLELLQSGSGSDKSSGSGQK